MKKITAIITIGLFAIGTTLYSQSSSTKIGSSYFHSDGTSTTKIGSSYFDSDGSSTTKIGSSYFNSNNKRTKTYILDDGGL